jgi:DNA-binding IclR family transcriptional regulator
VAARVPAVERASEILGVLAAQPGKGLRAADVAQQTGIHRASCFALLQELARAGLVSRQDPGPSYCLGAALIRYGHCAAASFAGYGEARRQMHAVAAELGTGCLISCRLDDRMLILDSTGVHEDRFVPGTISALRAPAGTVYYAWAAVGELFGWLRDSGLAIDDVSRQDYLRAAATIRARGYSLGGGFDLGRELEHAVRRMAADPDPGALEAALLRLADLVRHSADVAATGATGTSVVRFIIAPVFDHGGHVVMTVTLVNDDLPAAAGPVVPGTVAARAERVRQAADEVTRVIGGTRP